MKRVDDCLNDEYAQTLPVKSSNRMIVGCFVSSVAVSLLSVFLLGAGSQADEGASGSAAPVLKSSYTAQQIADANAVMLADQVHDSDVDSGLGVQVTG